MKHEFLEKIRATLKILLPNYCEPKVTFEYENHSIFRIECNNMKLTAHFYNYGNPQIYFSDYSGSQNDIGIELSNGCTKINNPFTYCMTQFLNIFNEKQSIKYK